MGSAARAFTFRLPVRVLTSSLCCTALTMPSAVARTVGLAADSCVTTAAAVAFCKQCQGFRASQVTTMTMQLLIQDCLSICMTVHLATSGHVRNARKTLQTHTSRCVLPCIS